MLWLLASAPALLAGCIDADSHLPGAASGTGFPAWAPSDCNVARTHPSGNAPWLAPFDDDLDGVFDALEAVLGVRIERDPVERFDGFDRYAMDQGTVTVSTHDDEVTVAIAWPSPFPGPDRKKAPDRMEELLEDLGWDEAGIVQDGEPVDASTYSISYRQQTPWKWKHGVLEAITSDQYTQMGWYSSLDLRPPHDIAHADRTVSDGQARATAGKVLACLERSDDGPGQGPWEAWGDVGTDIRWQSTSLAVGYWQDVAGHHCGGNGLWVHIDATTQAFLGWTWSGCD